MEIVYSATLITVLLSVFAHGVSASPGARWYGRLMSRDNVGDDTAETEEVPALPERGPQLAE